MPKENEYSVCVTKLKEVCELRIFFHIDDSLGSTNVMENNMNLFMFDRKKIICIQFLWTIVANFP